jgi:hypothetical protein
VPPVVEELLTGQPTGHGRGPQPYRRTRSGPQDRLRSARRPQRARRPGAARDRGRADQLHPGTGEARPAIREVAGRAQGEIPVRLAGPCGVTVQDQKPMDYRDYLIRQHEGAHAAAVRCAVPEV